MVEMIVHLCYNYQQLKNIPIFGTSLVYLSSGIDIAHIETKGTHKPCDQKFLRKEITYDIRVHLYTSMHDYI